MLVGSWGSRISLNTREMPCHINKVCKRSKKIGLKKDIEYFITGFEELRRFLKKRKIILGLKHLFLKNSKATVKTQ